MPDKGGCTVNLKNGATAKFDTLADLNIFLLELNCETADDGSVILWDGSKPIVIGRYWRG